MKLKVERIEKVVIEGSIIEGESVEDCLHKYHITPLLHEVSIVRREVSQKSLQDLSMLLEAPSIIVICPACAEETCIPLTSKGSFEFCHYMCNCCGEEFINPDNDLNDGVCLDCENRLSCLGAPLGKFA